MKKVLAVLLAAVLLLSLAACGKNETPDAETKTDAPTVETESEAPSEEEAEEAETESEAEDATEAETDTEAEETGDADAEEEIVVMSYDQYMAAELDTEVTVDVYVQAHQSWWDDKISVYAADKDGAYFIYNMACSEEDAAKLEPGALIRVNGFKSEWSGEVEIVDATFEFATGAEPYIAEPSEVNDLLGKDELAMMMNAYVFFNGMTVAPSEDADGNEVPFLYNWDGSGAPGENSDLYFNVELDGNVYTFTVESYLCDENSDVYKAVENLEIGQVVDMLGYLYWYNGPNPHITDVADHVENESQEDTDDADIPEGDADADAVDFAEKSEGVMTYAEYMEAEMDSEVTVEVFVQDHQSWWEDKVSVYAADPDGAYFIYNMACSEEDAEKLENGTKIKVTGFKSEWSGEIEIVDATFEFCDEAEYGFVPIYSDVTPLLGTDALARYMNQTVLFTGMTVAPSEDADGNEAPFLYNWDGSGERGNDLYFNVESNGNVYTFTVESYLCDENSDVYQAVEALQIGDVIDMCGYLYWYNGPNPHIFMVSPSEEDAKSEGVMNWFEYNSAELDSEVTIEAYVMDTQSWWEDKITVYAADSDGAYFIYNLACAEEDAEKLQPGAKIRVNGFKSEWSGEIEITDGTFELLKEADENLGYTPNIADVTRIMSDDALALYMNRPVIFSRMTIVASEDADGSEAPFLYNWDGSGERGNDLYFNAEYNGEVYTFTVESYLRDQDSIVYQDVESLHIGDQVQLLGYLYWYNGPNPHITDVTVLKAAE